MTLDGYRGFYQPSSRKIDMTSLTQINDTQVSIVNFKSIPIVTTEMLAAFYNTETVRIQQNHTRNKERFVEGKHFFKIVGQELKDFVTSLKIVANSPVISNKVRSLILWTERGAARHAKMLDTDQAWDIFEQLEDSYFHRQEILAKTHKSEREPLTNAVNMLVAKTKHLNYSDAYKLVHQRFNVDHIEDIPYDAIPVAVEYVHHLIALFGNKENKNNDLYISGLAQAMIWVNHWWKQYGESIRILNPNIANSVHDYFVDGSIAAWRFVQETEKVTLKNQLLSHQWNLSASERFKLV